MALPSTFPNVRQIPDYAISDINGKQAYLQNQWNLPIAALSLSGSSEQNVALLTVPATSTASMFITRKRVSAVSFLAQFKFYIGPTASAGSSATPINSRVASANTSQVVCKTTPSSSANGTLLQTIECPSIDQGPVDIDTLIILDPGQSMLITCIPGGSTIVNLNLTWFEL